MSDLEKANIPLIGSLMQDIATPLERQQQLTISQWAMKTAMVTEQVSTRQRTLCYDRKERETLRSELTLPARTSIWLGRYFASSIGAFGTDLWIDTPEVAKAGNGCATSIIVGHLAIQILTVHMRPEYSDGTITIQPKVGLWDRLLIPIWPPDTNSISWPPPLSFTNGGQLSIARLMDRWRIGMKA